MSDTTTAPTTKPRTPRSSNGTTTPPKTPAQPVTAAAKTRSDRRKVQKDELEAATVVLTDALENEELLDPATNAVVDKATPVLLKLSQQFADGADISDKELALFKRAIDMIETRMDQMLAQAKAYTDEKVNALSDKTEATFVDVKDVLVKTNERIDDVDAFAKNTDARLTAAQRVPKGAYIVAAIFAVFTFFIWINTANVHQDVKLPDGTNLAFVYEPFNGLLGGFIAALTVFALVAFIGSHFKYERPLPSEPKPIRATVRKPENSNAIAAEEPKALENSSASNTTSKE